MHEYLSFSIAAFSEGVKAYGELWVPDETGQIPLITAGQGASAAASYSSSDDHKARTPPPDLPSLLLDSRIVFLGMPVRAFLLHLLPALAAVNPFPIKPKKMQGLCEYPALIQTHHL